MKKAFIISILVSIISVYTMNSVFAYSTEESKAIIKGAIAKYKANNYIGCISDLRMFTDVDKTSSVAWYYLGTSYMKIAMKDDARSAFDKVVLLNTVPQLTSYAIQAELCMDDPTKCKYQELNYKEIEQLRADPANFMAQFMESLNAPEIKDEQVAEIDKLIDGEYPGIHPEAAAFIRQEQVKIKQSELNASKK